MADILGMVIVVGAFLFALGGTIWCSFFDPDRDKIEWNMVWPR